MIDRKPIKFVVFMHPFFFNSRKGGRIVLVGLPKVIVVCLNIIHYLL